MIELLGGKSAHRYFIPTRERPPFSLFLINVNTSLIFFPRSRLKKGLSFGTLPSQLDKKQKQMNDQDIISNLHQAIHTGKEAFEAAEKWLAALAEKNDVELDNVKVRAQSRTLEEDSRGDEKVVEGVFDGKNMITAENDQYPVPANYASKSKLVEGDRLKLTIQPSGAFVFKQIELIPRKLVSGKLILDGNQYKVLSDIRSYNVLYASVTFYRAAVGDTVTVTVPEDGIATWGAIENIIPTEAEVSA